MTWSGSPSQAFPANFNASNSSNDFDNRSDDKGPEPEGVVIGKVFGRDYAFIGLERIGGVVVYDVSNPRRAVLRGLREQPGLHETDVATGARRAHAAATASGFEPGRRRPRP